MSKTSIEWTDFSISPIRARSRETGKVFHFCERISPGCAHCYAATMAQRFGLPDYIKANRDKVEFFLDDSKLQQVLRRKKRTRYFWEDCSDLFGSWVPNEWIHRCFAAMALMPMHTHQVLTKRADRMAEYLTSRDTPRQVANWMAGNAMVPAQYEDYTPAWPPRNIHVGFSAENQETFDSRAVAMAPVMRAGWLVWCSAEPLLGPIVMQGDDGTLTRNWLDREKGLRWVVVGGESGHGARICNIAWIRSLVEQCHGAGAACFVKQLGARPIDDSVFREQWGFTPTLRNQIQECTLPLGDKKGGDMREFPEDLRIRQFPEARP